MLLKLMLMVVMVEVETKNKVVKVVHNQLLVILVDYYTVVLPEMDLLLVQAVQVIMAVVEVVEPILLVEVVVHLIMDIHK